MADAAAILRQYGMGLADELVQAAQMEGIELAAAATVISMESNGRNVWGSDPVSTGGAYTKGGPVTKANYLAYRNLVKAGKIGRQGVGPAQCTSAGYQDTADALGGCWDPVANYRSGFRGLQRLIHTYGTRDGARRYNGSGPAAERYAATFMARYATWKQRLAGATVNPPPPGDDMAAVPQDQWDTVREQIADLDSRVGKYDLLDRDLRSDLADKHAELDEIRDAVKLLGAKVDALISALTAAQSGKQP